ncbi:alpha/beta fold hydrolase [Kitasatospora sp. NPDC096147]|uniref:alpha/beta fold hydrolase n=1 Tax=Kitasatospora sp. NPDC096147 TaxID=3364093 RepID=UPI003820227C
MDATRFWAVPGITAGLERAGHPVLAPDRPRRPTSWQAEAAQLARQLPKRPVALVAGSNGCSVAVRLALAFPGRVSRLLLAWPATAGDPVVDAHTRAGLTALGAAGPTVRALLGGETLRGVTDRELATLGMPVAVLPAVAENSRHRRRTVDALLGLLPSAAELPGCPKPPHPAFTGHLNGFLASVARALR